MISLLWGHSAGTQGISKFVSFALAGPVQRALGYSSVADSPPPTKKTGPAPEWDWSYVIGAKAGRKPAIKRPKRHQWHFCNPAYNADQPLPSKILVPHAPPNAADVDDWQVCKQITPEKSGRAHRRAFVRFMGLRDVDWRDAFHSGMAQHLKQARKEHERQKEAKRQHAWRRYKEQLFKGALLDGQQQGTKQ